MTRIPDSERMIPGGERQAIERLRLEMNTIPDPLPGSGDVIGTDTATDGHLAVFNTDGYHIKDGGPVPAGGGDMTKAIYDTDNDGVVDAAATAPWAGITDNPTLKCNWAGGAAPAATDDAAHGYGIGSLWLYGSDLYLCTDATAGAAVWELINATGGVKYNVHSGPPGPPNDETEGYAATSLWIDTAATPKKVLICLDPTTGGAVWVVLVPQGTSAGIESVSGNIVDTTDPANPIVNQLQADWTETDDSLPTFINNKPTSIPSTVVQSAAEWADDYTIYPAGTPLYSSDEGALRIADGSNTYYSVHFPVIQTCQSNDWWGSYGYVPLLGELCYNTDTHELRIGDGNNQWPDLHTLVGCHYMDASWWSWTSYILAAGELGYDTTDNILKVGNGYSLWPDLPAIGGGVICDSDSSWESSSYVLGVGVVGYATESRTFKVGNGYSVWSDLRAAGVSIVRMDDSTWETSSYILDVNEIGVAIQSGTVKPGNGYSVWANLPAPTEPADTLELNPAPASYAVSGLTARLVAGEFLGFGEVCYLNADGKYYKAQADSADTMLVRAMAADPSIAEDAEGLFLLQGYANGFSVAGAASNDSLFVSADNSGGVTIDAPSTTGHLAQLVGHNIDGAIIYFDPDNTWIELT